MEGASREGLKRKEQERWTEFSIEEHMQFYEEQGIERKEAMKKVAADRGIGKREVYQALL